MRRPFLIAGLLGVLTMLLAMRIAAPLKGHEFVCQTPFTNPVVALEFIGSTEELDAFFGSGDRTAAVAAMKTSINRDNFFIAGYALFLMAFALTIWMLTRKNRYMGLLMLGLLIGLADLLENDTMKDLIRQVNDTPTAIGFGLFRQLHTYTWAKWLGLAAYFAALIPYLWTKRLPGRLLAFAGGLTALLGVVAWFLPSWIEKYSTAVFLTFPVAVLFCFLYAENPVPGSDQA
ncbi:MAG: hypothetical protein EP344_08885 [Bacteroidetes bacterium]|nr:MAG: hypothetical protein EP344_08885 [Bacteroidota bacterium]